MAIRSSKLAQFLADAQTVASLADGPCVPAAAQGLEDRLKADEAAITGQSALLTKLQGQLAASDQNLRQAMLWLWVLAGAMVTLAMALIVSALRRLANRRRATPATRVEAPVGSTAAAPSDDTPHAASEPSGVTA